jgi:hypothetical protein
MKLVTRSEWGARAPKSSAYLASTLGVKVHYTGEYESPELLGDHTGCSGRLRSIQNDHMDGNGWDDIAYNFLVCDHGYVFEGRGPHVLCAANGPGLNSGHYAVCGLVGNAGVTHPPDDMLNGIRDAIEYLRAKGAAGNEIKGHRDGYSTDCPGDPLYAWVRAGAPRPVPDDDDLPGGLLIDGPGQVTAISLPRGRFKQIGFIADNGLQRRAGARLRVAVGHGSGQWQISTVVVDGAVGQTVLDFADPPNTSAISVRREDAGDVPVAWAVF